MHSEVEEKARSFYFFMHEKKNRNSYSFICEDFKIISTVLEKNGYPTGFPENSILGANSAKK